MKKYFLYLGLIMFSLLGTELTDFCLGVWVLKQPNPSITSYSFIWFFEEAPAVLLAPFIGSLVDRWSKKKMIIYGQVVAGIGTLILMLLYNSGELKPWHIMIVSGIGSIASMFVFTAFYVATTALVPKSKLVNAQGISLGLFGLINVGVPMAAPALYRLMGMDKVFLIDIVTFSVAILVFFMIQFVVVEKTEEKFNMKNDWKLVKGFLVERQGLIKLLAFFFIIHFLIGLVQVLFTPLILDFADEYAVSKIMTIVSLGMIVGALIMGGVKKFKKPIQKIMFANIFAGILIACLWTSVNTYGLAILGMSIIILFTISDVINEAFYLAIAPVKLIGRLGGFEELLVGAAGPLAFLLSGVLVDTLKNMVTAFPKTVVNYFPGTSVTLAIIIVFTVSGVLLFLISLWFSRTKSIKNLDLMYDIEMDKSSQKNNEDKIKKENQNIDKEKEVAFANTLD
ncbi:hypothetical protein DS884_03775 [Tenacibaculum sp. E3R01]|uniref:MFS transporter n=1 Tax=Tenacibaculum sp. E3R01 TaxID=2267227 RepID=UPI000DE96CC0|nr:MFS transporter [Tenacibaculum sp. E3R01]RBW60960.1 hypothetical protein DS884_03775 [Tenacibaculum sp. E3R01]